MTELASKQLEITTLPFTDLYIRLDSSDVPSRFRPDPMKSDKRGNLQVPAFYSDDIQDIRAMLLESGPEGTLTYKGLRLRFTSFMADEGENWSGIRCVPLDLPMLDNLSLHSDFVRMIRGWGKRQGLVVVGGKMGDGKTTTAIAALKDYLDRLGGLLYTLEDPVEYQIQGAVSDSGFCLQNEINSDAEWSEAMKRARRLHPDYIFVGEIRTPEGAMNLLRAMNSGQLIMTTIHAASLSDTLSAILQMAEISIGPEARNILADKLVAAVHQTMTRNGPKIQVVAPIRGDANDMTASIIRKGTLSDLDKHIKSYDPQPRKLA